MGDRFGGNRDGMVVDTRVVMNVRNSANFTIVYSVPLDPMQCMVPATGEKDFVVGQDEIQPRNLFRRGRFASLRQHTDAIRQGVNPGIRLLWIARVVIQSECL